MSRFSVTGVSARVCAAALVIASAACGGSSNPIAPTTVSTPATPSAPAPSPSAGGGVQALGVTTLPAGNPTCSELAGAHAGPGTTWFETKLDRAPNGTESFGDGVISVSITNGTKTSFNFSTNIPVDVVLVKSGSSGNNLYKYAPEATAGTGLTSPGAAQDISHITLCYDVELEVSELAATTFTRDFDWTVTKAVDKPAVTLAPGADTTVNYSVAVSKDAGTDSEWEISGTITVHNPHPTVTAGGITVADNLTDHGAIAVSCPANTLAPKGSMVCNYGSVALASGSNRTNTASAASTTYGIARGHRNTAVAFVTPTRVLDNSVAVSDTFAGAGLSATAHTASKGYNYSRTITSTGITCGTPTTVGNTASITGDDSVTRNASADVAVTVTCPSVSPDPTSVPPPVVVPPVVTGCALSQGYWSTHSSKGSASKYDDTWAKLGEDKPFYLSGNSNYAEINVPAKGNAYHILSSQFIAAKLNMLKGAAAPAGVDMAAIDAFYKKYTPAQIDALKGSDAVRKQALDWAGTLDSYNNGKLNVKHCG